MRKNNTTKKKQVETQIEWRNATYDAPFNPKKKYYAYAQIEGKEVVLDYVGQFRTEANVALEEIARLNGGKLVSGVHVFK
jgi:hypothetical protein